MSAKSESGATSNDSFAQAGASLRSSWTHQLADPAGQKRAVLFPRRHVQPHHLRVVVDGLVEVRRLERGMAEPARPHPGLLPRIRPDLRCLVGDIVHGFLPSAGGPLTIAQFVRVGSSTTLPMPDRAATISCARTASASGRMRSISTLNFPCAAASRLCVTSAGISPRAPITVS